MDNIELISESCTCSGCGTIIPETGLVFYHKEKSVCPSCVTSTEIFSSDKKVCMVNKRIAKTEDNNTPEYKCLLCHNWNEKLHHVVQRIRNSTMVRDNPAEITLDITKSNTFGCFISAFGSIFLLSIQVRVDLNQIISSVRLLIDFDYKYNFELCVENNDLQLKNRGFVTHIIDNKIDALMSISNISARIGGFETVTLTVTITQEDKKDFASLESSADSILKLCYADRANYCSSVKQPCKNFKRDCTYADIPKKREKHEFLFCPFAGHCQFCLKDMSLTGHILDSHYTAHHKILPGGIAWRATTEPYLGGLGGQCLLETTVGTSVCVYRQQRNDYSDTVKFAVYTPLSSSEIEKYFCEIILRNVVTGQKSEPIRLNVYFDEIYDWYIEVKPEWYLPNWNSQLDVTVNIIKKEN